MDRSMDIYVFAGIVTAEMVKQGKYINMKEKIKQSTGKTWLNTMVKKRSGKRKEYNKAQNYHSKRAQEAPSPARYLQVIGVGVCISSTHGQPARRTKYPNGEKERKTHN